MICDSKCCRRSGEKIWCKKNLGLKGLIEIHFEDEIPSVERRVLPQNPTRFPISKSKSGFVEVKHPDFFEHGVFSLIGLDYM